MTMYTVSQLARLSGVSARTLRHYDSVGLLCPSRTEGGYRLYGPEEVERLQQILLYRQMGMALQQIAGILDRSGFDPRRALVEHKERLYKERARIDRLICTVSRTIEAMEGEYAMKDRERFDGFLKNVVEENEARYGAEVRQRYGGHAAEAANQKVLGMSPEMWQEAQALSAQILTELGKAMEEGGPEGPAAQRVVALHRRWLSFYGAYPDEVYRGLLEMYVEDGRFSAYYDAVRPGAAVFLRDAGLISLK